jgi:hypothetical protein
MRASQAPLAPGSVELPYLTGSVLEIQEVREAIDFDACFEAALGLRRAGGKR